LNNAVFGDNAILLAARNHLARQQQQRPLGVIHQHQRVHLVATIGVRRFHAAPPPYEAACAAGFGHFHVAARQALVEGNERRFHGGFLIGPHHGKQKQVAALNRSQHAVGASLAFLRPAGGLHAASVHPCRQCEKQRGYQSQSAQVFHRSLLFHRAPLAD
jgi:hypothetical protein